MGHDLARDARTYSRRTRWLFKKASRRIHQRFQLDAKELASAMAEKGDCDDQRMEMGRLEFRSDDKRKKRLPKQSGLHAEPDDFLQRPATRDQFHDEFNNRSGAEGRDR